MRLGLNGGFLPADMADMTPAMCRRVRDLGFSGVFTRFAHNDPRTASHASATRVKDLLASHGLRMFQATGFWQNLITPDEAIRTESVNTLCAAIRLAGWLGSQAIDTGPGSMNPRGPWFPHPGNWTSSARAQLVKSLRACAPVARDCNVILSMEGHQLVTLESARVMAEVLDAVDSPWVACDYDSANWITLHEVYDTTTALNNHFDVLGNRIVSCHAKDIWAQDALALHLQDGCPGTGLMDFRTLLVRMHALSPDLPVLPEGCAVDDLAGVVALFRGLATKLNLPILDS